MFWSQWFWPQTYSIRVPCVYNRQQAWVSAVFSGLYIYICDLYACVAKSTLCIRLRVSILKMIVYDYQISSALTHTSWEAVRWSTVAAYVLGACKLKESTAVGFPFAQESTAGDSKEQTGEKTDKTGTTGKRNVIFFSVLFNLVLLLLNIMYGYRLEWLVVGSPRMVESSTIQSMFFMGRHGRSRERTRKR